MTLWDPVTTPWGPWGDLLSPWSAPTAVGEPMALGDPTLGDPTLGDTGDIVAVRDPTLGHPMLGDIR